MNTVIIVTETNKYVATGHLMECTVCAEELIKNGYFILFWINSDAEINLKRRIPCDYQEYEKKIEEDYECFFKQIEVTHPQAVIFNLREIEKNFLAETKRLFSNSTKLVCIDEFGHRNLPADIIINPMANSYYWNYGNTKAKLFCGAKYLILSPVLSELHSRTKIINNKIKNIVITMGGVDPKNYTSHLIDIISHRFCHSIIHVIIGGGNHHEKEIVNHSMKYKNIKIYKNILDLPQMMFDSDLLICAGGNTLHEAACIGIPTMVIPSMPHEQMTAQYFEKHGFGYVIDLNKNFYEEVLCISEKLKNFRERILMSKKEKRYRMD